jgi:hypothetical protein
MKRTTPPTALSLKRATNLAARRAQEHAECEAGTALDFGYGPNIFDEELDTVSNATKETK